MLDTTHVLVALALAKNIQNPALAFAIGAISHLALDALPHYDFQGLLLKQGNREFGKRELTRIGKLVVWSDVGVSLLIFFYLSIWGPLWPNFPNLNSLFMNLYSHPAWVLGVLGGIFPDMLTLLCWKTGFCHPLWFFKFHKKIQPPKINPVLALAFQVVLNLICLTYFLR